MINEHQSEALDGVASIRIRPAMYVGDLESPEAITTLLTESVCLALDNAATGCATEIMITLSIDGSASIRDNGPGLDVTPGAYGKSIVDHIFTSVHACRDYKKSRLHSEELCGLGIVATNALSEWLTYETSQNGYLWRQRYKQGVASKSIEKIEACDTSSQLVSFRPDSGIFGASRLSSSHFVKWFAELSLPVLDADIRLIDQDGSVVVLNARSE